MESEAASPTPSPAGRRGVLGGLRAEGCVAGLMVDLSSLGDIPVLFTDPFVQGPHGQNVTADSMFICSKARGDRTLNATKCHEGGARATSLLHRFVSLGRLQLSAPGSEEVGTARAQIIAAARLSCILHHRICEARGRAPPSRSRRRGGELFAMAQSWVFSVCSVLYSSTMINNPTLQPLVSRLCARPSPAPVLSIIPDSTARP